MKSLIRLIFCLGLFTQACAQEKSPTWEAPTCDSTRHVGNLSIYDMALPIYRTDSLRKQILGASRIFAMVRQSDGTLTFLGAHWKEALTDSLARPTTRLDSLTRRSNLAALIDEPEFLYDRWAWLLDSTRNQFIVRRDSLVDSLQHKLETYEVRIISDLRNADLQTKLLKRGNSMAPISFHQLGLAADIGIFKKGRLVRNAGPYDTIGELTPNWNLYWGGNFVGFIDPPHFQAYPNAAAFLKNFPALRMEFEPFYDYYIQRVKQKIAANKEEQVEDTKALLRVLNDFRTQMPCPCQLTSPNSTTPPKTLGPDDVLLAGDLQKQTLSVWRGNRLLVSFRLGIWGQ
ncbi:MAG: M15 family metallopeptidase [Siphonobacter sp.]